MKPKSKSALRIVLGDRPIAYHPVLARVAGSVPAGVLLGQLLYWDGVMSAAKGDAWGGWFYKSGREIEHETALKRYARDQARGELVERGLIETKLKGVPATLHYKIQHDALERAIEALNDDEDAENSSLQTFDKLDSTPSANQFADGQQTGLQTVNKQVRAPSANKLADSLQTIHENTQNISHKISTSDFNSSNNTRGEDAENAQTNNFAVAVADNELGAHVQWVLERAKFRAPAPSLLAARGVSLENALLWGYWLDSDASDEFDKPHGFAVQQMKLAPNIPPTETDALLHALLDDPFRFRCPTDCHFCARGEFEKVIDALLAEANLSRSAYQAEQERQQRDQAQWFEQQKLQMADENARQIQRAREFQQAGYAGEIPLPDGTTSRVAHVWTATLAELQLQMSKATFDTWVKPTFPIGFRVEGDELVIGVRNAYAKQWLDNRLYGMIERTLQHVLGRSIKTITFALKTSEVINEFV
jgi:uncharacterized membrane-anchored protein